MGVAWFSAGVSSAVAIKLAIDRIDRIFYIHIKDQHEDTMRFVQDCEQWFGKEVCILSSPYKSVEDACRAMSFIRSPHGAVCTKLLKRRVREEWEFRNTFFSWFTYIWGMDALEADRAKDIEEAMPQHKHIFPLIDHRITKGDAHKIMKASGIRRPAMYDMGYSNNNCIGCVKGGMGYWNHIRKDFPEVFKSRAEMERAIGASCISGVFLDELDPERGRSTPPIVEDCGIFCEALSL
ncbi:MAG: phosphoadenosine phosphosulfate reductase [Dehalococcoidia bacterium]|nr:MAG: phosphoadenosine phosphosulfate reductase [Dehalococcoidia bacterium]